MNPLINAAYLFSGATTIESQPINSGQRTSFRAGHVIVKPVDNAQEYTWLAMALDNISFSGFSVAKPLRSINGNFIEEGFGATQFFDGSFSPNQLPEKLLVSRHFHKLTKEIEQPLSFHQWTNPWKVAQRIAWEQEPIPRFFPTTAQQVIEQLLVQSSEPNLTSQFVHCDLSGNILFNGDQVIIIDITPGFFPVEYAESLLVADSIAWYDQPTDSHNLLGYETHQQRGLLSRAVAFRLSVVLLIHGNSLAAFTHELTKFRPITQAYDLL